MSCKNSIDIKFEDLRVFFTRLNEVSKESHCSMLDVIRDEDPISLQMSNRDRVILNRLRYS